MNFGPLRWLVSNFRTLILALGLALLVWVSSVVAADPNEERTFRNVPLDIVGKAQEMLFVSEIPAGVDVILYAPRSQLGRYENQPGLLRAVLDLSGIEQGTFVVNVQIYPALSPTRVVSKSPESIEVTLDRLVNQQRDITLEITGNPSRGYQAGELVVDTTSVSISGAETLVNQVTAVIARIDISAADETIETQLVLRSIDQNGDTVTGVKISPETIKVTQPITLLGGYRNVVVRVVTQGQVANGYRLTNISVSPPNVIVFSSNPQLVNDLPGFVESEPLDLTGLSDDLDVRMPLNLPPGVSVVGDQSVLVQVNMAAIESSLSLALPVDVIGLGPGLISRVSPDTVDVIVSGPVLALDNLQPQDVRVYVDVTELTSGVYQLTPQVDILRESIVLESVQPETLEVRLSPGIPTPRPTITPTFAPITSTTTPTP